MMDEAAFWKVIEDPRRRAEQLVLRPGQDFIDPHEQTLADELRRLPPADVFAFSERLE